MKNLFLSFVFIISTFLVHAQNPTFQWARGIGGVSNETAYSVSSDAAGNVYTSGYFQGTVDFDPGPGTYTLASAGTEDIFVSKLDANGVFIWAIRMGGTGSDYAVTMTADAAGNVYVTGYYNNTVDFDPGVGIFNLTSQGVNDIYICKLNTSGALTWVKSIGGTTNDIGYWVNVDASGNVYTTGYYTGTVDFDPGVGTFNMTSAGGNDMFITKLDVNGNFIWAKSMGGSNNDIGYSIDIDAAGNVYTTGYFLGTADFDPGVGVVNLIAAGNFDIFVLKLNSSGSFVWVKQIGQATADVGYALKTDAAGNVYTTGYFTGTVDFDPGAGVYNLVSAGGFEIYVSKLDVNGNFVWANKMGSVSNDAGSNIAVDAAGNVYTTGYYSGTVDFDPGVGTYSLTSVGNNDLFVSKVDANGVFVWAQSIGGTNNDYGSSIDVDALGGVYTTGYYAATVDFDPGVGVYNLTSVGAQDFFVHKMNQCIALAAPTNTTVLSNQTICSGQSATLSAVAGGTVFWYPSPSSTVSLGSGTNFVTPTLTAGTYTYYAEAANCTISISRTPITVTVNPNPVVTASSNISLICVGESATLTASGGVTYSWTSGGTSSNVIISPTVTTSYTVNVTDVNGCSGIAFVTQSVSLCTNISAGLENVNGIKVYPNPSGGIINVEVEDAAEPVGIELTNALGQVLLKGDRINNRLVFNAEHLPAGIYFVQIKQKRIVKTVKLLKQ